MKTLKKLSGPFLELNFYIPDLPEAEAFRKLIAALINLGTTFSGQGEAHQGPGIRDKRFAAITDDLLHPMTVENMADLDRHLADENTRLIQVYLNNASGTSADVAEVATYDSISSEAMAVDRHPVAIWTEGWMFSGPPSFRKQYRRQARKAGKQIYERFRALLEVLEPAYAAITSEWGLECPTDLRRDPRSHAFDTFFVSEAYVGAKNLAAIKTLFAEGYIETVGDGIYVSSFGETNPTGKTIDHSKFSSTLSGEVAKIIASVKRF